MSEYTRNQIREYGIKEISKILPLDEDSLSQMVDYVLNNLHTRQEMSRYFQDLIGDEPDCVLFISKFQDMVFGAGEIMNKPKITKKEKVPVMEKPVSKSVWGKESSVPREKITNNMRLSRQLTSTTTSQLIDKKPSTKKKTETSKASKKRTLKSLQDVEAALAQLEISRVDDGMDSSYNSRERRVCNCMGTRHPVFSFYPNCLNCGKIICSKEGLQPCSFCGKNLLTEKERMQILSILTSEKLDLESQVGNSNKTSTTTSNSQKQKKKDKVTISLNAAGEHNLKRQDAVFKRLDHQREQEAKRKLQLEEQEKVKKEQEEQLKFFEQRKEQDPELLQAQERLEKLLNFQSTGAERTKIIDRASDFDLPNGSGNLWSSPMERALQLKRQQRQLRKQEEEEKNRTGRGRRVLDMSIRDGKVFLREEVIKNKVSAGSDGEDEVMNSEDEQDLNSINELKQEISKAKKLEEAEKVATYWDYEKDKLRWEKPVYLNDQIENEDVVEVVEPLKHMSKVQMAHDGETEDMLISLPTS